MLLRFSKIYKSANKKKKDILPIKVLSQVLDSVVSKRSISLLFGMLEGLRDFVQPVHNSLVALENS